MIIMFMKKTARSALAVMLVMTLAAPLVAAVAAAPVQNVAQTVTKAQTATAAQTLYNTVRVNGAAMTQDPMVTYINGVAYVAIRPVAQALDAEVETMWDGKTATLVHWGLVSLTATPGMTYVVANDRYLYVPGKVAAQNGAVMLPLDTLCKVFDATCISHADGTFDLFTGSGAITYGGQFYNSDDLYWLSRIINAESGNQPLSGKIAVGNVVLNRTKDSRFPSTVKGVVCQKSQFTPVSNGTINLTPNAESVIAAKLCLDGAVSLENVLYFNRAGLRCWASNHRPFVATISGHSFYA